MEIWKDIPGYEGIYQASKLGQIKSLKRPFVKKDRILKPRYCQKGYVQAILLKNKIEKSYKVHRLVMLAFVGPSKLGVNHKNGIKNDNRLENLEYSTAKQNTNHAWATGLAWVKSGESHPNSKLTTEQAIEIFTSPLGPTKLGRKYNVHHSVISDIKNRKIWKHATGDL